MQKDMEKCKEMANILEQIFTPVTYEAFHNAEIDSMAYQQYVMLLLFDT